METVLYELSFNFAEFAGCFIHLIVGIVMFFVTAKANKFVRILFGSIGVLSVLLFVIVTTSYVSDYMEYKDLLESDECLVVEGQVENYSAVSKWEKGLDSFEVNGVHFEYGDAETAIGYHLTQRKGGVVTGDGQYLVIKYVYNESFDRNSILYIAEKNK